MDKRLEALEVISDLWESARDIRDLFEGNPAFAKEKHGIFREKLSYILHKCDECIEVEIFFRDEVMRIKEFMEKTS